MFDILKSWYEMGLQTNDSLKDWVIVQAITADQFQQITGVVYQ
ncbi:XkdX family protein [Fructobacillus ficulneus]|uniref:Phage uncharacterized protein, XkdX family n=1 Tax=Fructobacillus ficulneus TaxID=157463 RepID=A0A0K8MIV8_9LACO|nr:XkdX family protein [Fructobacillus ficulneus]GAO99824.1 phage uncharacterized protein, XkdX family [Fructobacillus ficulneus]